MSPRRPDRGRVLIRLAPRRGPLDRRRITPDGHQHSRGYLARASEAAASTASTARGANPATRAATRRRRVARIGNWLARRGRGDQPVQLSQAPRRRRRHPARTPTPPRRASRRVTTNTRSVSCAATRTRGARAQVSPGRMTSGCWRGTPPRCVVGRRRRRASGASRGSSARESWTR